MTNILFVDSAVTDYQSLLSGVVDGVEAIALSPSLDGIRQITDILQQRQGITAIHIYCCTWFSRLSVLGE